MAVARPAAAPLPELPSASLELGLILGAGANCTCVEAFDTRSGETYAAKLYNDEHGTNAAAKVARVLAAESLCDARACPSLLACCATAGSGGRRALLYQRMEGTLSERFASLHAAQQQQQQKPSGKALLLRAARSALRHLLVALHYLHARGLCHGDVHVGNAMATGDSLVLLADLESVHAASGVDAEYDLVAAGHVLAQLLTGQLGMESYPACDADKAGVRAALISGQAPRVHDALTDPALALAASEEPQELRAGLHPTTHSLLSSLLRRAERGLVPDARTGWELLLRSPSLHGPVEAATALNECNRGASAIYLDRHKVFPADYCSALEAFCLSRGGTEDKVQIRFWRRRAHTGDGVMAAQLRSLLSPAVEMPKGVDAGLADLAGLRVRVADAPGTWLKGFQLVRLNAAGVSSPAHLRFAFWSLTVPPAASAAAAPVEEAATEWDDAGPGARGSLFYLDRHRVQAPAGSLLKGFELQLRSTGAGAERQVRVLFWHQKHGF